MIHVGEKLVKIRGDIQHLSPYPGKVRIVAVTKRFPIEIMAQAAKAGITAFGENRMQEALHKFSQESFPGIERHFIGTLQSNKVQDLLTHFEWFHSLDRLKIAGLIAENLSSINILIQVNTSRETSKHGLNPDTIEPFVDLLSEKTPGLNIKGLMTMGPLTGDTGRIRQSFILLRELRDKLKKRETETFSFDELSMGMTNDYKIALEEGATIIRIGQGLFGPRPEGL
jgi:hypothetical protein